MQCIYNGKTDYQSLELHHKNGSPLLKSVFLCFVVHNRIWIFDHYRWYMHTDIPNSIMNIYNSYVISKITALINYIIAMVIISPSISALHDNIYCKQIKPHINECHSFENEFHNADTFDATHQYTALELLHCVHCLCTCMIAMNVIAWQRNWLSKKWFTVSWKNILWGIWVTMGLS